MKQKMICFHLDSIGPPTTVSPKTNLNKGDLFVISLNEEGTQKILMQVDDERQIQTPNPGFFVKKGLNILSLVCLFFFRNFY